MAVPAKKVTPTQTLKIVFIKFAFPRRRNILPAPMSARNIGPDGLR
jgi:hypothetical protein